MAGASSPPSLTPVPAAGPHGIFSSSLDGDVGGWGGKGTSCPRRCRGKNSIPICVAAGLGFPERSYANTRWLPKPGLISFGFPPPIATLTAGYTLHYLYGLHLFFLLNSLQYEVISLEHVLHFYS